MKSRETNLQNAGTRRNRLYKLMILVHGSFETRVAFIYLALKEAISIILI